VSRRRPDSHQDLRSDEWRRSSEDRPAWKGTSEIPTSSLKGVPPLTLVSGRRHHPDPVVNLGKHQ
jgi:hypothetical protein